MAVTPVPVTPPNQNTLLPYARQSPFSAAWWTNSVITGIPQDAVGWLVAQGWQIGGVSYDQNTTPPTPYYGLYRQSLANWAILQSLLNSYTSATNEALLFNTTRYNQVVQSWTAMIDSADVQFEQQATLTNEHVTLFLGRLDEYMSDVDTLIDESKSSIDTATSDISTKLSELNTKLASLDTDYSDYASEIETLITDQETALDEFSSDVDAALTNLETAYTSILGDVSAELSTASGNLSSHVGTYNTQIDALLTDYATAESAVTNLVDGTTSKFATLDGQIEALVSSLSGDYANVDAAMTALLNTADSTLGSHVADFNSVVALLATDYTSHSSASTGYLTDLGATELARINELFNNRLAAAKQSLVDRGWYATPVLDAVETRIERERDEAIAALNDKLNREKLENEHRLYEQRVSMRLKTLDSKDRIHTLRQEVLRYRAEAVVRLYGQLQEMRARTATMRQSVYQLNEGLSRLRVEVQERLTERKAQARIRTMEGKDRLYALRDALARFNMDAKFKLQDELVALRKAALDMAGKQFEGVVGVKRSIAAQRDNLLKMTQEAVLRAVEGKEKYVQLSIANAQFLVEQRTKLAMQQLEAMVKRLDGLKYTHELESRLLAYQLDARNQLMIGLFGFVEKRSDEPPDFSQLTQLAAGLGDSGGGWLTT